jgi:hypothetical protein
VHVRYRFNRNNRIAFSQAHTDQFFHIAEQIEDGGLLLEGPVIQGTGIHMGRGARFVHYFFPTNFTAEMASLMISDHRPLWAEFDTSVDDD